MNKLIKIGLIVAMVAIQAGTLKAYHDECSSHTATKGSLAKMHDLYSKEVTAHSIEVKRHANTKNELNKVWGVYNVCLAFEVEQTKGSIANR